MSNGVLFLRIAGIVVGFPAVTFAFGWAVLGRWTRLDAEERFAGAWGLGFAVLGCGEFLAFAGGADERLGNAILAGLMLLAAAVCSWGARRQAPPSGGLGVLAGIWLLAYLHLVCIQALLPNYVGSNWYYDWWMHYDEALVFLRLPDHPVDTRWASGYSLASRTPLFDLTAASVLSVAGSEFWVFQLADALLSSVFIAPVYLLLRDLFGPRAARLGILLAPLNLWMLHLGWFTWPKMLAAYYLVLGLYFYLQFVRLRRAEPKEATARFLYFWFCMWLGFMTHQVAVVYLAPLLLHAGILAWRDRAYRSWLRDLVLLGVIAGAIVGPWYGWLFRTFGSDQVRHSSPVTAMPHDEVSILGVVHYVALNDLCSVVPVELLRTLAGPVAEHLHLGERFDPPASEWIASWGPLTAEHVYDGLTQLYFSLFTGALTLSLGAHLLCVLARRLVKKKPRTVPSITAGGEEWTAVWAFALFGAVAATALHPSVVAWGVAHAAAFASVVVLVALAWGVLSRAPRRWAAVVCAGMVLEFLVMFWSHWSLRGTPGFLDPDLANPGYKQDAGCVFLNDALGSADVIFFWGAVGIQACLVWLLARWVRENQPWRSSSANNCCTGRTNPGKTMPPSRESPEPNRTT